MRLRTGAFAALSVLVAAAPARAQQTAPQPGEQLWDRVVAVVGDTTLLYSDVLLELEAMQSQGQPLPADPQQRAQLVQSVVERRVDDLMILEAARQAGVTVSPADVAGAVESQVNRVQQNFGSEAAFQQALAQSGRSLEQYRQTLTQQYVDQTMIQRYMSLRVQDMGAPPVSEDELRAYFEQNRERLGTRPATLSFHQVIIKPEPADSAKSAARREAEGVLAELRGGAKFDDLARRHSDDPSAPQGGDLGWFRQGQMVRNFELVAFSLRPGETSGIVETEFGYHIIKLEKVRGPERQARHILFRPTTTDADVARARQRADSVAAAVRAGASINGLSVQYGTPAEERVVRDVRLDRMPPAYATVFTPAQQGEVLGPFEAPSPTGSSWFVVAQVDRRQAEGPYTLDDVREQVRERVQQEKKVERVLEELRASTHVAISL